MFLYFGGKKTLDAFEMLFIVRKNINVEKTHNIYPLSIWFRILKQIYFEDVSRMAKAFSTFGFNIRVC